MSANYNPLWYYCDPGVLPGPPYAPGVILGPFRGEEMLGKFERGEFYEYTLMRRECDEVFVTRFHMEMLYARVPFIDIDGDIVPPPILRNPERSSTVYINPETWARVEGPVMRNPTQPPVSGVGNEEVEGHIPAPEVGQVGLSYQHQPSDENKIEVIDLT